MKKIKIVLSHAAPLMLSALLVACGDGGLNPPSALAVATDAFMVPYLSSNGITAATLTIMKGGVVLQRRWCQVL
jgi:hypothetical protein